MLEYGFNHCFTCVSRQYKPTIPLRECEKRRFPYGCLQSCKGGEVRSSPYEVGLHPCECKKGCNQRNSRDKSTAENGESDKALDHFIGCDLRFRSGRGLFICHRDGQSRFCSNFVC